MVRELWLSAASELGRVRIQMGVVPPSTQLLESLHFQGSLQIPQIITTLPIQTTIPTIPQCASDPDTFPKQKMDRTKLHRIDE